VDEWINAHGLGNILFTWIYRIERRRAEKFVEKRNKSLENGIKLWKTKIKLWKAEKILVKENNLPDSPIISRKREKYLGKTDNFSEKRIILWKTKYLSGNRVFSLKTN